MLPPTLLYNFLVPMLRYIRNKPDRIRLHKKINDFLRLL